MATNWKERIFRLNYTYLVILKEAALRGDSLTRNALGVPPQVLQAVEQADDKILKRISEVGVPFFRLQAEQVERAIAMADHGDAQRAQAMLLVRALAQNEGEDGEEARGG